MGILPSRQAADAVLLPDRYPRQQQPPPHHRRWLGAPASPPLPLKKKRRPLKAPVRLSPACRTWLQTLLSDDNVPHADVVGIMLRYQQSTTGEPRMVFLFDFVREGQLEKFDEAVSLYDDENDDDDDENEYDSDEEYMLEGGDNVKLKVDDDVTKVQGGAGNVGVCVNILISFVGAGMLGMPKAFQSSGWLLGTVILCLVSTANVYSMLLLVATRRHLEQRDPTLVISGYGELGLMLLGPGGELLVNVCLVVSQLGFGTAYIIFISANVTDMVPGLDSAYVCLACVPFLTWLVQIKDMKTLSPFSLLADVCNLLGLGAVLFQDASVSWHTYHHTTLTLVDNAVSPAHFHEILYVASVAVYSLEGVGLILPLESSCKNKEHFPTLLKSCILFVTILMAVFGTAGYMTFGDSTLAPITLNLTHGVSANFVKAALCLALYLTYPIMLFPVHDIVEETYHKFKQRLFPNSTTTTTTSKIHTSSNRTTHRPSSSSPSPSSPSSPRPYRHVLFRASMVFVSAVVAYAIPDFGKFLALVGSSICTILGFILPGYFHLRAFGRSGLTTWELYVDLFLIAFGVVFGTLGTHRAFVNLTTDAGGAD